MSTSLDRASWRSTVVGVLTLGFCMVPLSVSPSFAAFRVAVSGATLQQTTAPAGIIQVWGWRGGCWGCGRFGFRRFDRDDFRRFGFRRFDRFEDRFENRFFFPDFR